ncbi:MAG: hypothetical protein RLZZ345_1093 [Actinomycetota bacterium]|jgi:hypothetical protein
MQKIGCFGWIGIWLMGLGVIAGFSAGGNPLYALPGLIFVGIIVFAAVKGARQRNKDHSAELLVVAGDLDAWVDAGLDAEGNKFDSDEEQLLFVLPNVELLEYKSTGSTYSGGSAGVSFPLFGRVRGNVGGNRGEFTRNPEQLILSDIGRLKVSTQRLIYVGEKETREIDLDKVLDFELGPNGLWVKLAMSNRQKREGFQHMQVDQIPIGMAIGIAKEYADKGLKAAQLYAKNLAADIRATIAAEAAAKRRR